MNPDQPSSRWWLAAILFPFFGGCLGFVYGFGALHQNADDWFGMHFLMRILGGLFVGCLLSCVATVISVRKSENLSAVAVMAGIPSLFFVAYVCTKMPQMVNDSEQDKAIFAARQQEASEREAQIVRWHDEFLTNTALITDDDFWKSQRNQNGSAIAGLSRLIEDKAFEFDPIVSEYIFKNLPQRSHSLILHKRLTHADLIKIVNDTATSHATQQRAVYFLISDESFEISNEWKLRVLEQFPDEFRTLCIHKRLTKSELEAMASDPKSSDSMKQIARLYLRAETYKADPLGVRH